MHVHLCVNEGVMNRLCMYMYVLRFCFGK